MPKADRKGAWARWQAMVASLAPSEEGGKPISLRGRHWVAYKALLADLLWEGVLTEAEAHRRRARLGR